MSIGLIIAIGFGAILLFSFYWFMPSPREEKTDEDDKRKRTVEFDPNFTLVLKAVHFLANSRTASSKNQKDFAEYDEEIACEENGSAGDDGAASKCIRFPLTGGELDDHSNHHPQSSSRVVSGECAICLNSYQVGNQIIWSSNPDCKHAFHLECMKTWTDKVSLNAADGSAGDEVACPCCRQAFIGCVRQEDDEPSST